MKPVFTRSLLIMALLFSVHAQAEYTVRDLQVIVRTLSFLESPFTGEVVLGIVYDPGNARSRNEAQDILQLIGSGLQMGSVTLKAVLAPIGEVDKARMDIILLTEFLDNYKPDASVAGLPCITVDLRQVMAGNCVVGIQSTPRVEILVNHAAAQRSGLKFSSVFRMMIKEI